MKCNNHVCEKNLMLPSCVKKIRWGQCDLYSSVDDYAASMGCLSVRLTTKEASEK